MASEFLRVNGQPDQAKKLLSQMDPAQHETLKSQITGVHPQPTFSYQVVSQYLQAMQVNFKQADTVDGKVVDFHLPDQ